MSEEWTNRPDVSLAALPATIARAEEGDVHSKRRLLDLFCATVDSGRVPYPALLTYLSTHFAAALDSKASAEQLGKALLGGPAHRTRSPEHDQRDQVLAMQVSEAIQRGFSELEAFEVVAAQCDSAEGVVQQAWRRFKDSDWLKD